MPKIIKLVIPILFAIYGLIVIIDYYLPYSEKTAEIESILKEDVQRSGRPSRTKYSVYTIKIDGESVRTDAETYQKDTGSREADVFRTKILGAIIKINTNVFSIHLRSFPYFLFPLFPLVLLLPIIAFRFKNQNKFYQNLYFGSLLVACVILVMSLI